MKDTESLKWVQALRPIRCCRAVDCTEYQGFEGANARGCFREAT
jgi:hypothetical protein